MDLHKNYLQTAVMDEQGNLLSQERIPNRDENIEEFASKRLRDSHAEIVIESSSTWYHVYELLSRNQNCHVVLSNPVKTKAIASAKVKTDKVDALTLANLLRTGYIPESYIPPRHHWRTFSGPATSQNPTFHPDTSWTSERWSGTEHPWSE